MTDYTPGPWIIATSCSWRRIINERGDSVCVPSIQRHDNHPDLSFPNRGCDGPDARLIAAAPDMYEALKEMNECYQNGILGSQPGRWSKALDSLSIVLAKAEGKS